MRRLYYRDSYGRWHEDQRRENRPGIPGGPVLKVLLVLTAIIVIASMIHM
jgi:hypothetical protein